jgi:hypothetical protein
VVHVFPPTSPLVQTNVLAIKEAKLDTIDSRGINQDFDSTLNYRGKKKVLKFQEYKALFSERNSIHKHYGNFPLLINKALSESVSPKTSQVQLKMKTIVP